jgi:excisionase family DNA binding protein
MQFNKSNQKKDIQMELRILEILNEIKSLIKTGGTTKWLSLSEVCTQTSLSKSSIRRAISTGQLKCSRKTGKLLFKVEDVERWLNG